MLGRFDEARAILTESRAELAERGGGVLLANITAFESVWVELWAGDPAAAAEFGAEGSRLYLGLGEPHHQAAAAGYLAQALYALDRLDEADTWATARPSWGRVTTSNLRCSGGRGGRRCSRAVASTPRPRGSPARRSRSAKRPTC